MNGARLAVSGLHKCFAGREGDVVGVRGAVLALEPGRIVVIAGGPASGRTSLLRCVTGTYRPDAGSVILSTFGGVVDLAAADSRTVAWVRALELAVLDGPLAAPPRQSAAQAVGRVAGCELGAAVVALARLDAGALADVPVGRLRPSEATLVALAAALAKPASVIVLDEPDGVAVDRTIDDALCDWLQQRAQDGAAVLATTSHGSAIERFADSILTIERGELRCPTP